MAEEFFATCPRGLETVLALELERLGAAGVRAGAGGAAFGGSLATAYAASLHSRIASRILWRVAHAHYHDENDLYEMARAIRWEEQFSPNQRLCVDVTATRSPLRSLQFATLRVKDGICDRARDLSGTRPDIDRANRPISIGQTPKCRCWPTWMIRPRSCTST